MGARTSNRKREDEFLSFNRAIPSQNSSDFHASKRLRFSPMHQSPERPAVSSNSSVARLSRYPEVTPRFGREVHAPCRIVNYGVSTGLNRKLGLRTSGILKKLEVFDEMGSILSHNYNKAKDSAIRTFRYLTKEKEKEVIEVDSDNEKAGVSEDSSIEEVEVVDDDDDGVVTNVKVLDLDNSNKVMERGRQQQHLPSSSSQVLGYLANGNLRMDNAEKMLDSLSLNQEVVDLNNVSAYKKLLEAAERRSSKLKNLNFQIELKEKQRSFLQTLQPAKKPVEAVPQEPFVPLSKEEKAEVERAFNTNRRKVVVTHENSNIEITGELLLCLRPGAWLNDEVINVYLELLKEREKREPQKFLKCHFFNTFFYKKIISGKGGYDYKSVRRWTSQRKLGYGLIECDKIFVPIHKEIHWCLAVINMKDEKLQYLDSLGGKDTQVLRVLARYFVDEVKDKSGKDIDLSSWKQEFVEDLPEQKNGFDCGMFMIKYADFYSRGLGLCFSQEHMPYFRQRTAKEILRLRAD